MKIFEQQNETVTLGKISWANIAKRLGTGHDAVQCLRKYRSLKYEQYNEHNAKYMKILGFLNRISECLDERTLRLQEVLALQFNTKFNTHITYTVFSNIFSNNYRKRIFFENTSPYYRFSLNHEFLLGVVLFPERVLNPSLVSRGISSRPYRIDLITCMSGKLGYF